MKSNSIVFRYRPYELTILLTNRLVDCRKIEAMNNSDYRIIGVEHENYSFLKIEKVDDDWVRERENRASFSHSRSQK